MRIPLDYYRILGLPIQATAEQLRQAHRDRTLQLPRREYSEAAIVARKQLLDEAYAILSNPEKRQAYDATFLTKSYDLEHERLSQSVPADPDALFKEAFSASTPADPYTSSIEIQDHQFVGALLILLELGEYELVLKLGRPYLSSGSLNLNTGRLGQPDIVLADIVLTLAFACLELGREQWQQAQYENAAESLQTGQELLLREGLFASVRGEMQSDLFKLRPYRILELLALPEANEAERRQGMNLLRDMLQDRGGIDGSGDDQSGLTIDDFLRFIQQLRSYLTSAEQQTLFEVEARRPSAVATYLAVYALLARGFAYQQPALIRRAKLMLVRLGTRQDVHLEQAVCALLLGQTEEASRALELSQEYESLAFIREHSQGSPDLLPGLCLYAERWLQNEVFPHFRDLAHQQVSLKDYFANEQVQAYLEELPNEVETPTNQWTVVSGNGQGSYARAVSGASSNHREVADLSQRSRTADQAGHRAMASKAATATLETTAVGHQNGSSTMPTAERVSQLSPEGRLGGPGGRPSADKRGRVPDNPHIPKLDSIPRHPGHRQTLRLDRLMFTVALGFLGVGLLIFSLVRLTRANNAPEPLVLQSQFGSPLVTRAEPLIPPDQNAPLTNETAQEVVETWLQAKAAAMGRTHAADQLPQILTGTTLTAWQAQAAEAEENGVYYEYEHSVKIESVTPNPTDTNQTQVVAEVVEAVNAYSNGQPDVGSSRDETLQVQYDLIRQDGQWRIQEITVLP
ncbi:DUF4101 domain-containing protein [Oscillatoria sp. FACHB-1407]|uniref:IMS domain-containing protein n=1 Tax=Oscillatoria sp. FACHB-1407 TaxID=2692847 RepID=UPI001688BA28|nr:IMS domain-containing protein [Oscillatoria sp. FACHB-1407]MBD2463886.1 DUF4101 domain-containing protein [Oscillatoria sp. FACHB-1407]